MSYTASRTAEQTTAEGERWGESFEELVPRMWHRVRRIVRRYQIPDRDGEDLVQTTLLLLWREREKVEDAEAWLVATLRNQCLMYWRDRGMGRNTITSDKLVKEKMQELESNGWPDLERLEYDGARLDLRKALGQLSKRHRQVVILRVVEGMKPGEVARELGYKANSMRKVLGRALETLREELMGPEEAREEAVTVAACEEGRVEEPPAAEVTAVAPASPLEEKEVVEERRPRKARRRGRRRGLAVRLAELEAGLRRMEADVAETVAWLNGADDVGERLEKLREGQERLEREVAEAVAWLRTPREVVVRWTIERSERRPDRGA